jgi:transcriptional regulator with XRE-family HTH domain
MAEQTLGASLAQHRSEAGISQAELSRTVGVAQSTISRIEADLTDPTASTLYYLAAGIGCPLSSIVANTRSPRFEQQTKD